jgi:aspartate kinase
MSIDADKIFAELHAGRIVVVAGFQGEDEAGNITTLGRGGSDTTAVAIAAALKADICEIYTDVDGVFTTNPNICAHARKIDRISYDEMLEMASLGAKVLQTRSVEFAKKYGVAVHVRSSFHEGEGTIVCEEEVDMEKVLVSGVTYDMNQARIEVARVPDRPGIAAQFFNAINEANILVDMIIQTTSLEAGCANMAFTVSKADFSKALQLVRSLAKELGAEEVIAEEEVAKVSMIGAGMRSHSGVASKMFGILAKEGINIKMISTSEIKISCIIDNKYTELAVRALHDAFDLDTGKE